MRIFTLSILTGVILFSGCGSKKKQPEPTARKEAAIPVKTAIVVKKPIQETIKTTGELQPIYRLDIFPRVAGIVKKEFVKIGDVVRKDQVLAELIQDVPGMEFSPVQIEATNAGTIVRDQVEIGARVTPQQPVYTISKIKPINLIAEIPEIYLNRIDRKAPVSVVLDAFPGKTFSGRIVEISPAVNPANRTVSLKILLPNSDRRMKPGMFARAYFVTGGHEGLVVPLDAVVHSGVNTYIFVVRNGKAREVKVSLGTVLGEHVELTGAITEGDTVVVMGQNLLEGGSSVTIVEER